MENNKVKKREPKYSTKTRRQKRQATETITIRVQKETKERLKANAKEKGLSMSQLFLKNMEMRPICDSKLVEQIAAVDESLNSLSQKRQNIGKSAENFEERLGEVMSQFNCLKNGFLDQIKGEGR